MVLVEHEASTELDNVDDGTHGGGEEPKGRSLTVMPSMPTTRLIVLYRLLGERTDFLAGTCLGLKKS